MKWLEIIELRSANCNRKALESQVQKLINEVDAESQEKTIKAYSRAGIDTDFSIHLNHYSRNAERSGSTLGLRLALLLKEYGLVNHSVWIELISE